MRKLNFWKLAQHAKPYCGLFTRGLNRMHLWQSRVSAERTVILASLVRPPRTPTPPPSRPPSPPSSLVTPPPPSPPPPHPPSDHPRPVPHLVLLSNSAYDEESQTCLQDQSTAQWGLKDLQRSREYTNNEEIYEGKHFLTLAKLQCVFAVRAVAVEWSDITRWQTTPGPLSFFLSNRSTRCRMCTPPVGWICL